jgi:hypothetical protein
MRNLKKVLALVLALVMTMSVMSFASAATAGTSFTDDASITDYDEAIQVLEALGIFKGGDGNEFNPTATITREQAAAILYRVYTGDVKDEKVSLTAGTYMSAKFSDVDPDAWYAGYVGYCYNENLMKGYDNGKFGIGDDITGFQMLVMLLRALGYDKAGEFTGGDWEFNAAILGTELGIVQTLTKGTALTDPITRGAVAQLTFQVVAKTSTVGTYTASTKTYASNSTTIGYNIFGLCGGRAEAAAYFTSGTAVSFANMIARADAEADNTPDTKGVGVQNDLTNTGYKAARYGEPVAFWYAKTLYSATGNKTGAIAIRFNAVVSETKAVSESTLFAAAVAAGATTSTANNEKQLEIALTDYNEDGKKVNSVNTEKLYASAKAEDTYGGGSGATDGSYGGYGTSTELFVVPKVDGSASVTFLVVKNTYVDTVDDAVVLDTKGKTVTTALTLDNITDYDYTGTSAADWDYDEQSTLASLKEDDVVIYTKWYDVDNTKHVVDYTSIQAAEHKTMTVSAVKSVLASNGTDNDHEKSYFEAGGKSWYYNAQVADADTLLATALNAELEVYFDYTGKYVVLTTNAVNKYPPEVYVLTGVGAYPQNDNGSYYLNITVMDTTGVTKTVKAVGDPADSSTGNVNTGMNGHTGSLTDLNADYTYKNNGLGQAAKSNAEDLIGKLVTLEYTDAGYYLVSYKSTKTTATLAASNVVTKGDANCVSNVDVDTTTIFIVTQYNASGTRTGYTIYKGIKELKSLTNLAGKTVALSNIGAADNKAGGVDVILIDNATLATTYPNTVDTSLYVYLLDNVPEESADNYNSYKVIQNGEVKSVKVVPGSTADSVLGNTSSSNVGKMILLSLPANGTGYYGGATVAVNDDAAYTVKASGKYYYNDVLETTKDQGSAATKLTLADNCVIVDKTGAAKTTDDLANSTTVSVVFDSNGYVAYLIITT